MNREKVALRRPRRPVLTRWLLPAALSACSEPPVASRIDAGPTRVVASADRSNDDGDLVAVIVPRNTVDVAPRVEGKLREVLVRQGDRVVAGQVLARIDDFALRARLIGAREGLRAARADLRRARSEYRNARRRARRRDLLVSEGVVALEEADDARSAADVADEVRSSAHAQAARLEAEIAQLERDVEAAVLTAPFDGRVARVLMDPGTQLFPGGKGVVTVISDGIVVKFAAPPERASEVAVGRRVHFRAPGVDVAGVIATVAPELDPAAKMLFATVELAIPPAEWPAVHTVGRVVFEPVDAAAADAGVSAGSDAGPVDAGVEDAGGQDAGGQDAGGQDAAGQDAAGGGFDAGEARDASAP